MGTDKIPKLKGMLTEAEYTHVEAFPSVLRLLLGRYAHTQHGGWIRGLDAPVGTHQTGY